MLTQTLRTLGPWLGACAVLLTITFGSQQAESPAKQEAKPTMQIHYLEIVSNDLEATCATLEKIHGVTFGEPNPTFGNARIAKLKDGGSLGVRAPMHDQENTVVRPYLLVDDIAAAVKAAQADGATIAIEAMHIPEHGTIAIYFQGGNEYGLWQKP